ncbi:putative dimethylaniline monooxygenase [Echria macrotheca]|uniref:Dimethylaniline monooxygenase n=1 Tax=Echria macrotheca TaxID=438768 RepID=A0AAJ0F7C8_9PEZI|nr:putative dimethylaniline monooxygenase [Echria macrotheca]
MDILIIGAGPSGLCAAKTFLQHDAAAKIRIVDSRASLGGVWSQEQIYPTLKTNNVFSMIDFSDFPMDSARFGIGPGEHVTGETMNAYLRAYADHFHLTDKLRLNTRVVEIRRQSESGGKWEVVVDKGEVLSCDKLVVATGVLSSPHLPEIQGSEEFHAPLIHSSSLGREANHILHDPGIKSVAVLGGSKSSYDAVHLATSTGHTVEWIIRKSGRGPVWVFPAFTMMGPFRALREGLVTRRFISFMSPWSFPDYSGFAWLRKLLHSSPIGRAITQAFWGKLRAETLHDCRYQEDKLFGDLEPEQNPFWYGTSSGVLNYDADILALIKSGQVRVHRSDVSHLSHHAVHLKEPDRSIPVDAFIACTGYSAKPSLNFSPSTIHSELGVPTTSLTKTQIEFWSRLEGAADATIGTEFPRLLGGPFYSPTSTTPQSFNPGSTSEAEAPYSPWRLYRGIAPPGLTARGDNSLVFLNMFSGVANTPRIELQCLWTLAYFCDDIPSVRRDREENKVWSETALLARYARHRSPYGHGRFYPDLVVDQLPYWDLLLHDLGLETRRKGGGWRELFETYGHADYKGVVDEWVNRRKLAGSK